MKNKILASLLAVCLFVGLAVPAFAAASSSQAGLDEEITALAFAKDSYTVQNGGDSLNLANELSAFAGNKKLVLDPSLEWSIKNDSEFAFAIDDSTGVVSASEDKGTAVVTVTANNGKVKATVKLAASKTAAEKKLATGFAFKATTYTVLTGANAVDGKVVVIPTGTNTYLSDAQKDLIIAKASDLAIGGVTPRGTKDADGNVTFVYDASTTPAVADSFKITLTATATAENVDTLVFDGVTYQAKAAAETAENVAKGFVAKYNAAGKAYNATEASGVITFVAKTAGVATRPAAPAATTNGVAAVLADVAAGANATGGLSDITAAIAAKNFSIEIAAFPTSTSDASRTSRIKKTVSLSAKPAKVADKINAAGDITIEVGERANVKNLFKQGPSSANVMNTVSFDVDYVDDKAEYNDYAILTSDDASKGDIIGVAVGKNKITATTSAGKASIIVTVVERGTKKPAVKPSLNPTANMIVGGTHKVAVKDAGDAKITFSSYNDKVATVAADGTIKAIAEGTTKVKVAIEGSDSLYVTVTVKKAPAVVDPTKPTTPPQTGVSFFSL